MTTKPPLNPVQVINDCILYKSSMDVVCIQRLGDSVGDSQTYGSVLS